MKNLIILRTLAITIGVLFISVWSSGQVFTPPTPAPSSGGGKGSGTNTTVINQSQPSNNQILGSDVPFIDPTTNNFQFDGKQFNIMDNSAVRARFEKYLNTAASSSELDLAYRKSIRDIIDTLSPHNKSASDRLASAVARLQHAAVFPQDARLCESLANVVYRVFLARQSADGISRINRSLEAKRRQLDWNFDQWKDGRRIDESKDDKGRKGKGTVATDPTNAGHIQRYIQRIGETEASRVANKAKMELSEVEAKLEFQALIVQLFLQRRHEHVIIGARLYTEFFKDGAGRIQFEEGSDVEETFTKTIGFNPTITTLDAAANEAIRDVSQSVESFTYLIENNEIDGATRQIQQAFITGEYLPDVQSVPRETKRKIQAYARNGFQLTNAIEVKDYGMAEDLIEEMRGQARDFDYSKPRAVVNAHKLSSNLKLRAAKNAALKGDDAAFEKNLAEAIFLWPSNPAIEAQSNIVFDQGDQLQELTLRFDRLLSTQSYRQIYNDKARFLGALAEDKERLTSLEQILENIQEIEISLKQAETLKNTGNGYAAWEVVEKTFKKFPDDTKLATKRSDYAIEVSAFVDAIRKAQTYEDKGQRGSALAWFLGARRIYPHSENADRGIKRLVDDILPEEG